MQGLMLAVFALFLSLQPQESVEIEFDVRLPDGSQAEAAEISYDVLERDSTQPIILYSVPRWTPDEVRWTMPGGVLLVRALVEPMSPDREQEYASDAVRFDSRKQGDEVVLLQLKPRTGLRVDLTLDGERPSNGFVLVAALGPGQREDLDWLLKNGTRYECGNYFPTRVDAAPGRVVVGASLGTGLPIEMSRVVEVTESMADVFFAFDSDKLPSAIKVDLRIDGKPFADRYMVRVTAARRSIPIWPQWTQVTREDGIKVLIPDAAGRRLLSAIVDGEAGAAACVAVIIRGSRGEMSFGMPLEKAGQEIRINLEGLCELKVRVKSPLPRGLDLVAGVLPHGSILRWPEKLPDGFQAVLTDGVAVLGPLPAVPIDLVLWATEEAEPSYPVAVQSLELAPGVVEVVFEPLELHRLEVQVEAPATRANLWDHRIGDISAEIKDGTAVFPFVPKGEYRLSSNGSRCDVPLRVPAAGRVCLSPPPFDAVGVRVIDPEALDTVNRFQDGDLIVGVNGTRFAEMQGGASSIDEVQGQQAEFQVLRNGRQIRVDTIFVREGFGSRMRSIYYFASSTEIDEAVRIEAPERKD